MKKIRIKFKAIIIVLISLIIIFGYIIPSSIFKITKNISYKDREKAIKIYNVYLNTLSFNKKDEDLYNMATLMVPEIDTYDIFMGMRGGGSYNITKDETDEAIEYYGKILNEYEESEYYVKSYKNLLDIYTALGDLDKSHELMDWGNKSSNKKIKYISSLFNAFYYFVDKEYDKALNIVDYYIDKGKEDSRLYTLKGYIYFANEEYNKAQEFYKLVENMPYKYEESNTFFGNLKGSHRSSWLENFSKHKGDYKITGRVTIDGKGIPFAQIYVRDISKFGQYSSRGEEFVAITDSNGEFETVGFKEGQYEIGIGISKPLIYDMVYMEKDIRHLDIHKDTVYDFKFTSPMKIISPKGEYVLEDKEFTLKWEEIEKAEYYNVKVRYEGDGTISTFAIPDKYGKYDIVENQATLNLDVLNLSSGAIIYTGDEMVAIPQNILGAFYPQSDVPIIISAYDKDDNLINSTLPIKPFYDDMTVIKVKNRELTKGEDLILHREYEEAVKYYEELLKEDNDNKEALMYLSRICVEGWQKGTKDLDKGAEHSFRLYELTGNRNILKRLLTSFDMNDIEKHLEIFEDVFDIIPDKELDNDLFWERGRYYAVKGDFNRSREYYEKSGKYYVNTDIIYIDLYNREFQKALRRLKNDNFKFWRKNKSNMIIAIEGIKDIDSKGKEWLNFREFLYKSIKHQEDEDDFKKIYKSTTNSSIKLILEEIGIGNGWER